MGAIDDEGHGTGAGLGLLADTAVEGAAGDERWFLELDHQLVGENLRPHLPLDGQATGEAPPLVIGTAYAGFAVPLVLDPLATEGDDAFFDQLANLSNIPASVRDGLAQAFGEVPRSRRRSASTMPKTPTR